MELKVEPYCFLLFYLLETILTLPLLTHLQCLVKNTLCLWITPAISKILPAFFTTPSHPHAHDMEVEDGTFGSLVTGPLKGPAIHHQCFALLCHSLFQRMDMKMSRWQRGISCKMKTRIIYYECVTSLWDSISINKGQGYSTPQSN